MKFWWCLYTTRRMPATRMEMRVTSTPIIGPAYLEKHANKRERERDRKQKERKSNTDRMVQRSWDSIQLRARERDGDRKTERQRTEREKE